VKRVAALFDVHGNLPALEAVLGEAEADGVDLLVFGGDVAWGPLPRETLEMLMRLDRPARFVMGNADSQLVRIWDEHALGEHPLGESEEWIWLQLDREHRDFLAGFEPLLRAEVDGLGEVLFRHGSPRSETEIVTAGTPAHLLDEMLREAGADLAVIGHTHMQFDRSGAGGRIVNAGSVGMPYGEPGAHWAMLGPDVDLRRTNYDRDQAAERIRRGGWPGAEEFARENVLSVPAAEVAVGQFERMAGRA
jgi:predicted phosphodiesterase